MILARKIKLNPTQDQAKMLLETVKQYEQAINMPLKVGHKNKISNGTELHKLTYYDLREKTQLPSQLVCSARCKATESLKSIRSKTKGKFDTKQPKSKKFPVIRYDRNSCGITPTSVKLATISGRIEIPMLKNPLMKDEWNKVERTCELQYRKHKNEWYLIVFVNIEEPKPSGDKVLGIDRGCKHVAATSANEFYDSKHLRKVKGKYKYLRHRLQSKGTKSAKRLLKKISGKENRFVKDTNHCISKKILAQPYDVFVLEKLEIKKSKKLGKKFNSILAGWSWFQLEQFLTYKAKLLGKRIEHVDARYTSQKCSSCGHIERGNRQSQSHFCCRSCGFQLNADLNAARNIKQNFEASLATSSTGRASSTVHTTQTSKV